MSEKFGDGISQADTSSDVVPSGDLCLGEAVTRRQHLRQLLVLASTGALAVSGLSGCGKDAPKKSGKTAGNRPEGISKKVSPQKDVAETIRDNPISSPTFERIDGKVDFPVPNNVVMDKDQFVKSALQIIGVFENDLLPRFFSEIESRPDILKDVSKTNAVTLRCVQWLIDSIKKVYSGHTNGVPLVEGKMVVAETCDFINKFLNPAGYYLGFNYMGGKLSFDLCKISDSFLVRVSMDDESIDVPCLGLDSIAASPYKNNSIGGRGDSFLKYAVVFNQPCGVCDTVHRSVKTHPAFSSTMPNREQFDKMLLNGFFRHEATHVALGSRFPHSSGLNPDKNFKGNDQYKLPIVAKFGDDIVDYSGSYNLFQIHELCAVGAELLSTEFDNPYMLLMGISQRNRPPGSNDPYTLVRKLLPLAVLKATPNSAVQKDILNSVLSGDPGAIRKFQGLVGGTGGFTMEHAKRAGAILYSWGLDFFKDTSSGISPKTG